MREVRSGTWVQAWTDTTIPLLAQGVTATLVEAPNRHDGSNMFNVRVRFDAELFNSYLKVMRAFEGTTGGTVVRTRPVVRRDGTQDGTLWNITVRPDGSGNVTLALKTGGRAGIWGSLLQGLEVDHGCAGFSSDHLGPPGRNDRRAGTSPFLPFLDPESGLTLTGRKKGKAAGHAAGSANGFPPPIFPVSPPDRRRVRQIIAGARTDNTVRLPANFLPEIAMAGK